MLGALPALPVFFAFLVHVPNPKIHIVNPFPCGPSHMNALLNSDEWQCRNII